ncbi:uncharacterized protein LOC144912787 [Branchiostoma floridae x Branchiostoma belcheri]
MERILQHMLLIFLLIILKEPNMLEADCSASCSSSLCNCANFHLTSIPQNLPKTISILGLKNNQITTVSQSEFARYGNLIELDLNTNLITNIHNDTFSNLPRLQTLYLHDNKITKIHSSAFSNLPWLKTLYLQANRITRIQSSTLSNLTLLQELCLNKNQLTMIQFGIFSNLLDLKILYLHKNKISKIEHGTFSNVPQLKKLYLDKNKVNEIHPDTFSNLLQLKRINLHSNHIKDIQSGTLSNLTNLELLILSHNQITNIHPDTFPHLPKLRQLFLHGNNISKIPNGTFSNLPGLRVLYLYSNNISTLPLSSYMYMYVILSSIPNVEIDPNPWQCDCKMIPSRLEMDGTVSFNNKIKCAQPANLNGQRLKDINPKDLICKEPPVVLWYFNPKCSADQKIPHPVDTTFASLPVDTNKPESTSSHDNSSHESAPRFPLSVVIGTASGSVSGIIGLIGIIIFTIWCKRRARNLPSDPNTKVASGARNLPTAPQLAPPIPGGPIPPHSQHDDTLPADSEPHLYEDVDKITRNPKPKDSPEQSAKSKVLGTANRHIPTGIDANTISEGSIPPRSQGTHALPANSEPNPYVDMGPPPINPTPKGTFPDHSTKNKALAPSNKINQSLSAESQSYSSGPAVSQINSLYKDVSQPPKNTKDINLKQFDKNKALAPSDRIPQSLDVENPSYSTGPAVSQTNSLYKDVETLPKTPKADF